MGIFFRDENDNDDDEYTGPTGDPIHDAIYGWDMGSSSSSDGNDSVETNYGNVGHTIQVTKRDNYSKKAWDYYMEFKEEEALYYIDLALDLDKTHSNNWNIKAIILEGMKRYQESEECYNRSLELSKNKVVYENKARMLLSWSYQLLEESKNLPNGLNKLEEAKNKIIKAMNALPGDNDEDINKYLKMRDSIEFYIDYENKFQRNFETLKRYDKSELFTITGRQFFKNNINLTSGMLLKLVKEPDNEHDKDAIAIYAQDEKIGYVANKDYTKYELTSSASELQDKIQNTAKGSYLFYLERYVDIQFNIGRIITKN